MQNSLCRRATVRAFGGLYYSKTANYLRFRCECGGGIFSSLSSSCCWGPAYVILGAGKRGHYEGGLFTGGISRISKISKFSRTSRKWSDSPLFSTVWGFSKISRISKFSRISRNLDFSEKTPFPKDPFFRTRDTCLMLQNVCFHTPYLSPAQGSCFLRQSEQDRLLAFPAGVVL